jgi:hypothetical protein
VSPSRYQVEADSLDELNAKILDEYGRDAAIVSTTVVTTGGLQGFFAQRRFQATVELADRSPRDAHAFDLPARAGIAALLDEADHADTLDRLEESDWTVSTATVDFAAILADLTLTTAPDAPAPAPAAPSGLSPVPLRGAGDLVLVIGLGDDALAVARSIAAGPGMTAVRIAGDIESAAFPRIDGRRAAIAARADGVRGGHGVVVAFGLPRRGPTAESGASLEALHADQCWVAVDAGRKPEDTARWVGAIAEIVPVDAAISWAPEATSTPHSVSQLGLPVGWLEAGW